MENLNRFEDRVPRPWLCIACQHFELYPLGIPVDPTGESEDEADALCVPHRARMTVMPSSA